jgi:meso-butanediol dehydrogenase / (S,S)-butanediol dehydrogenase / diacetyl reductase
MTYNLRGKVALVTGAGGERGFGRAMAVRLAREGARVAVGDLVANPHGAGEHDWQGLSSVVEEISNAGGDAMAVTGDVSDSAAVARMVREVVARFDQVDILVANAGAPEGPDHVPVVDLDEEVFDRVLRVNLKGTFLCCREVARHLVERGEGGRIIVMSSLAGKRGMARYAAYSSSKFALIGLTQSLAHELGPYKVTVNAICPGFAITERALDVAGSLRSPGTTVESQLASMIAKRESASPLGRVTEAEDVAKMAAFLASDQAGYLTGLSLSVAGGEVMM